MLRSAPAGEETLLGPVFPVGYELTWWAIAVLALVVTIAAVVKVVKSRELSSAARAVWVLLILLAPPLGAIAALLLVPKTARASVRSVG